MKKIKITAIIVFVIVLVAGLWFGIYSFIKPLLAPVVAKVNPTQLTTAQKLEDFNYLYKTMTENYPFFEIKKRMLGYDWPAQKKEFEKAIRETKNDKEFYAEIDKIVNLAQNAHTHILGGGFYDELKGIYEDPHAGYSPARRDILNNEKAVEKVRYWDSKLTAYNNYIPIIFRYVEGKYAVLDGNDLKKYDIPKGAILTKVDGVAIDQYIKSLNDRTYLYYDYKRNQQKLDELILYTNPGQKVKLTLETPNNEIIEKEVKEELFNYDIYKKYYETAENDKNYDLQIIKKNKVAYIRLKSMMTSDSFSSDADGDVIYDFLKKVENYPYLIVDIRGNGGGSDGYWRANLVSYLLNKTTSYDTQLLFRNSAYIEPFIEDRYSLFDAKTVDKLPAGKSYPPEVLKQFKYFVSLPEVVIPYNPVKFEGKIYLLVDGGVYSAAETFASFAKSTGWATLVGTSTGGDGNIADPALMMLPNSGIVVRFSSSMGLNPDGTANEEFHTAPDIYVEQTYDDFLKQVQNDEVPLEKISKYDTVLNNVLQLIQNSK